MIAGLETTRAAFVQAARRRDSVEVGISIVVIRLLAVAVTVPRWPASHLRVEGMAIPKNYRDWPRVESNIDVSGKTGCMRLWVCPQASFITDDEPFPVGTTLVVETFSRTRVSGGGLQSVFVMEKVSSVDGRGVGRPSREGWTYAAYNAVGQEIGLDAVAAGICRLSIIQAVCGRSRRRLRDTIVARCSVTM